ncbi:30S ribosome-binding factor RbfA [Peptococcaceae bacterium 1198_IL3148]
MSHRTSRMAETIKQQVAEIIQHGLKDPRVGFASITMVEVSGDKRHAKIYVSVLGDDAKAKETIKALKNAQGYIRTELSKRLKVRFTPEIIFELDSSISHGVKIMEVLKQVEIKEDQTRNE